MILNSASVSFRDSGTGWSFWLVDYYDPSGQTKSSAQDSPVFTADVHGNPFNTDTIYQAASSHPVYGDGLVPFRFDSVTGLPVIVDVDATHAGTSGGNSNALGGYTVSIDAPADGQGLTFTTLPNGKKVLVNTNAPTLDTLATATPELLADTYEADRASVVVGGKVRAMAWTRFAEYVAVTMQNGLPTLWNKFRAAGLATLDNILRANPVTDQNIILTGEGNLIAVSDDDNPTGRWFYRARRKNGQTTFGDYLGWAALGQFRLVISGVLRLIIDNDTFVINHGNTVIGGIATVGAMRQRTPEISRPRPEHIYVGNRGDGLGNQLDSQGTMHQQVVGWNEFITAIVTDPLMQAAINTGGVRYGSVEQVLCRTVAVAAPSRFGPKRLTAALLNTAIAHPLETAGTNIICTLYNLDGSADTTGALLIDYPDTGHVRFRLAAGVSDYPGGAFKLETIQS